MVLPFLFVDATFLTMILTFMVDLIERKNIQPEYGIAYHKLKELEVIYEVRVA